MTPNQIVRKRSHISCMKELGDLPVFERRRRRKTLMAPSNQYFYPWVISAVRDCVHCLRKIHLAMDLEPFCKHTEK